MNIKHIAIIMDGNRRWAREKKLPIFSGHKKVADDILEPLIEHASEIGIKYITFWAWSTENWQRNVTEVTAIMRIFRQMIAKQWQRLHEKGVRIKVIGDISKFDKDIQDSLEKVVEQTKNNQAITTVFALNYGGRDEIIRAINKAISNKRKEISNLHNKLITSHLSLITETEFAQFLDTVGIPDPEIIVRTGGEQRLSGFMPWQSEYSELFFPNWLMPEFTPEKLDEVITEYNLRQRRFGK